MNFINQKLRNSEGNYACIQEPKSTWGFVDVYIERSPRTKIDINNSDFLAMGDPDTHHVTI